MMGVFSFFFSSRRRHTRSLCDWSSDVCSSDLRSVRQPPIHILPLPSCNQGRTPETTQATIISEPSVSERSEEHTSELQSHSDLVCRLLLEKKKKKKKQKIINRKKLYQKKD